MLGTIVEMRVDMMIGFGERSCDGVVIVERCDLTWHDVMTHTLFVIGGEYFRSSCDTLDDTGRDDDGLKRYRVPSAAASRSYQSFSSYYSRSSMIPSSHKVLTCKVIIHNLSPIGLATPHSPATIRGIQPLVVRC